MAKKKSYKAAIIAGFIGLFLLLNKKAKAMAANKFSLSKFTGNTKIKLLQIQDALINAGIETPLQLQLALAQILLETGQFTSKSRVAALNNNYSGIKWLNKSYQKASKGSPVPGSERSSNPDWPMNYYAKFASDTDWAKDFIRILSLGRNKPINATTVEEYVSRLAKNRYFDARTPAKIENYRKNVALFFEKIG